MRGPSGATQCADDTVETIGDAVAEPCRERTTRDRATAEAIGGTV
jgi:hypothetical protein